MFKPGVKIHFVGIGGVGMSGLARVILELGVSVSGSDINLNSYTATLGSEGAQIYRGHKAVYVRDADFVVYSSSISQDNIELVEARRLGKPVISRLTLFREFSRPYRSIMVTGTHGKTTITAIISHVLIKLGLDPTVLLGGDMSPFGNACLGKGPYLVAELDESDGEFVKVTPGMGIITNIENDHLDQFGSLSGLDAAFKKFVTNIVHRGSVFLSEDVLQKFQPDIENKRFFTFGFSQWCDYCARDVLVGPESRFSLYEKGMPLGEVSVSIPGRHNVMNALGAIGVLLSLGLEFDRIRDAIVSFHGVSRRFELKGDICGIKVIEDYAHHPTEIKATLSAARLYKPQRILVIFQPHRYTRTHLLRDEFVLSFADVDFLAVTEIYSASEVNTFSISSQEIVRLIKERDHKEVHYFETPEEAAYLVTEEARPGDMIFILGAGDVNRVSEWVVERLKNR